MYEHFITGVVKNLYNSKHRIMKLTTPTFFVVLAVVGALSTVSSCSQNESLGGTWQGNPERIMEVEGASFASSTMTLDFVAGDKNGTGRVDMNSVINVTIPQSIGEGVLDGYEANVTAIATMTALYAREDGSNDDYMLSFNPSSLEVSIDPASVSFSENMQAATPQAQLDSLSRVVADRWQSELAAVAREQFQRYSRIEDVKIHHTDMMSCEVDDRDQTFRRIAQN